MEKRIHHDLLSPRTRAQIAAHLGFSPRTLKRKLEAAQIKIPSGLVSPKDQMKIYEALGYSAKLPTPTSGTRQVIMK